MTRNEKILYTLRELSDAVSYDQIKNGFDGFTTEEICEKSGFSRTNVSKELNILCKNHLAVKISGRPVRYFDIQRLTALFSLAVDEDLKLDSLRQLCVQQETPTLERGNDAFWGIQQTRPSLANVINQCKAAIIYPPNGLNTLLVGPSGVGKTFFAEIMYLYAKEMGLLKKTGKFVVFNCAEYADNPQLLLSELFGYAKGAFTGAAQEKQGIIDQASGGILLLDEVHRLPPQGQEMLFTLIDKGYFRRLGDSENTIRANLRLICATTEDLESNMLATFLRRIPMIISIPPLKDAPLGERYSIVKSFFENEANTLGIPIKVSRRVLISILLYLPKGNLGQLRSDIRRLCARAYLEHKLKNETQTIEIATDFLQGDMVNGLLKFNECREEINQIPFLNSQQWYTFYGNNFHPLPAERTDQSKIYLQIEQLYEKYKRNQINNIRIERNIQQYIQDYMDQLIEEGNLNFKDEKDHDLSSLVGERIYFATKNALEQAAQILHCKYKSETVVAMALHVAMLVKCLMKEPPKLQSVSAAEIQEIADKFPEEYFAAQNVHTSLERDLSMSIPEAENAVFAVFLLNGKEKDTVNTSKVSILLVAHGASTASSICNVVNRMTKNSLCHAIDMDLDETVEHCLDRTIKQVADINMGAGVLLLADMGSLMAFSSIITEKTGIPIKSLDGLSTQLALEAARKCLVPHATLEWIHRSLVEMRAEKQCAIPGKHKEPAVVSRKKQIVVTCLAGLEAATKLSGEIASCLGPTISMYLECVPFGLTGDAASIQEDNVLAVVGEVDLDLPSVPYISINSIRVNAGIEELYEFLESDFSSKIRAGQGRNATHSVTSRIERLLVEYLNILNPTKVLQIVTHSFETLKKDFLWVDPTRVRLNYILHCSCMIERVMTNQALLYDHLEERLSESAHQVQLLRAALRGIEEIYCIKIPDTELAYLLDLIDTQ